MSKKNIHNKYITQLNEQVAALAEQLLDAGLLMKEKQDATSYRITEPTPESTQNLITNAPLSILSELFEFRNTVNGVYRQLFPDDNDTQLLSLKVEQLFHDEKITLDLSEKDKRRFFDYLDGIEELITDNTLQLAVEDLLKSAKINLAQISNRFLLQFARRVTMNNFDHSRTVSLSSEGPAPDMMILEDSTDFTPLLFEFKVRKSDNIVDEQMLLQALAHLKVRPSHATAFYFLVIFTNISTGEFGRTQMRFKNMKDKLPDFTPFIDQVQLVLVNISNPVQLNQAYKDFNKEFGTFSFTHEFRNQSAPREFPQRNDEFYPEIFQVKKCQIEIELEPLNTPFWRFGLRFSPTKSIAGKNGKREDQADTADIYIAVGDLIPRDTKVDLDTRSKLSLRQHKADFADNSLPDVISYLGRKLILQVDIPGNDGKVIVRIQLNDRLIGSRFYILPGYRYFKLFSWADNNPFAVRANVTVKRGQLVPLEGL